MICMQYKLELKSLNSRRGRYTPVILESNPLIWEPTRLDTRIPRHRDVMDEVSYAMSNRLFEHKYWKDEPMVFVQNYADLYKELFSFKWLHKNEDRHNIVVNQHCCLTLVQYHNHRLIAYSRSTDMRNGYFSDQLLLNLLASEINFIRPDCEVKTIEWYLAIPHVYDQKGVARLLDKETME